MKHIRTYNSYKNLKLNEERTLKRNVQILSNIDLTTDDLTLFKNVFETVYNKTKMTSLVKEELDLFLSDNEFITEGFFDKLKERFPKAAEYSKKLSDKAEQTLSGILQKVKDAVSFVKKITEGIKEFFIAAIQKGKDFYIEQIKSGKLKAKVDELAKTKKEGLIDDLKTIKEVADFYRTKFMGKLISSTETNFTDFLNKDQEPVVESIVNEGANVIATLVHKIEAIPPFSWLEAIAKAGEKGASAIIGAISSLTQKMGGKAFELPVVAILIGIMIEQIIKGDVGHWLIHLAGPTPLGMAIKGLKITAAVIAFIVALDSVIGGTLGVVNGHGHDEHSGEHNADHSSEQASDAKPDETVNKEEEM